MVTQANQSILDLVIQHCGSVEGLFAFAELNNTQTLHAFIEGSDFVCDVIDAKVVSYYKNNNIAPATLSEYTYDDLYSAKYDMSNVNVRVVLPVQMREVCPGQSLLDIAIHYSGSANALFSLANANNISASAWLNSEVLLVPVALNQNVVDYFTKNKIVPATQSNDYYEVSIRGDYDHNEYNNNEYNV